MPRVLLVGSSGGHLAQMMQLGPWWRQQPRWWVMFSTPDAISALAGERVVWADHSPERTIADNLRSLVLAVRTMRRLRPELVVSAGASIAVPFFALARLMRIPTVYVEVYDRIETPSLAGRICYRLASRFCVQWEEQRALYPGATVIGPLL